MQNALHYYKHSLCLFLLTDGWTVIVFCVDRQQVNIFLLECWHHHCETGRCNVACGLVGRVTPINLLHSMSWEPLPCMGALLIFVKCHGAPWCCHSHKTHLQASVKGNLISVRKSLEKLEIQNGQWHKDRPTVYRMTKRKYLFQNVV